MGHVWECNPQQAGQGIRRNALGAFNHEAVAVDPATGYIYMTEDDANGRLYRFVPTTTGDLSSGTLYTAALNGITLTWVPTSATTPDRQTTTTAFNGGEGITYGNGMIYVGTQYDKRVWQYDIASGTMTILIDCLATPTYLNAIDGVHVHPPSGDVYVSEDGGNMELCVIGVVGGVTQCTASLRITGQASSEVTGVAFTPDNTRMYVTSQHGTDGVNGITRDHGPLPHQPQHTATGGVTIPVGDDTFVRGGTYATETNGTPTISR